MSDTNIQFILGTLHDGRVVLDFRTAKVDHLKLTQDQALDLAQGLAETVRDAKQGLIIPTRDQPL